MDGLKTVYVAKAGYHIIVTAKQGDTRLIAVLLGAQTPHILKKESARLIQEGFQMAEGHMPVLGEQKGRT